MYSIQSPSRSVPRALVIGRRHGSFSTSTVGRCDFVLMTDARSSGREITHSFEGNSSTRCRQGFPGKILSSLLTCAPFYLVLLPRCVLSQAQGRRSAHQPTTSSPQALIPLVFAIIHNLAFCMKDYVGIISASYSSAVTHMH